MYFLDKIRSKFKYLAVNLVKYNYFVNLAFQTRCVNALAFCHKVQFIQNRRLKVFV